MFLKIKANNLNIVINLGQDLTKAKDVVKMFESNAKFINESYGNIELLKAEQTIELGNQIEFSKSSYNSDEQHIVITSESLDVGFVKAENNVFADLEKNILDTQSWKIRLPYDKAWR